jgi:hypothetical protein
VAAELFHAGRLAVMKANSPFKHGKSALVTTFNHDTILHVQSVYYALLTLHLQLILSGKWQVAAVIWNTHNNREYSKCLVNSVKI